MDKHLFTTKNIGFNLSTESRPFTINLTKEYQLFMKKYGMDWKLNG